MPRRSRTQIESGYDYGNDQEPLGPPIQIIHTKEQSLIVESFLKNNYWEMLQKLDKVQECTICLENITCKNCYTLLTCGHSYHLCCITRCQPNYCPLCRNPSSNQR